MGSRSFTDMASSFKGGSWGSVGRAESRWNRSAGLAATRSAGSHFHEPIVFGLLAEALGLAGETEKGLEVIAEALRSAKNSGARGNDAELHRLRGTLLGRLPSSDRTEMEASCRLALAVARRQGTRGFELRAAVSLARLLIAQERRDEAHDNL